MHRSLGKEKIRLLSWFSFLALAMATTAHAEPPSICSVHNGRIQALKTSLDQYHADKEARAQQFPVQVQACAVARNEIKERIRAAQLAHDQDLERTLTAELDQKTEDCQRIFQEMMDYRDSLEAANSQALEDTARQIEAITRQMTAARCDHPCVATPGYCFSDAPATGLAAPRTRTDEGRTTGVSGRLHGSCRTEIPAAIPGAWPVTTCEEFYNLGAGDISIVPQTCAQMRGTWSAGTACAYRQVQGICTIARSASPTHAVQRTFYYLDNILSAAEAKTSCITQARGMWEHPLN